MKVERGTIYIYSRQSLEILALLNHCPSHSIVEDLIVSETGPSYMCVCGGYLPYIHILVSTWTILRTQLK